MHRRGARRAVAGAWPRPAVRLAAGVTLAVLAVAAGPGAAQTYRDAARLYDGGEVARAAEIFRELARNGNVSAQVSLAGMYANGDLSDSRDFTKAARWYRKAAEAGNATAQMNLGDLLADGRGVDRDRVMGWVWLKRAAAQGRAWADKRAQTLESEMTRAERERARTLLADGNSDASDGARH